ncbi:MAG TPA: peptidoglycan DD-metalloendopeptidase family protein [Candidatus Sumerlaeota bacterium]|nr:peptidoglycan DD-metalloendopeptidase family protein [Candidatus Sumerlaeota bacterium]
MKIPSMTRQFRKSTSSRFQPQGKPASPAPAAGAGTPRPTPPARADKKGAGLVNHYVQTVAETPVEELELETSGQHVFPAGSFLPALLATLWLVWPLLALGLVWLIADNGSYYLALSEKNIVFRAVLDRSVDQAAAERLARQLEETPEWSQVKALPGNDAFASIPELSDWTKKPANQMLLSSVPVSLELRPKGFFASPLTPGEWAKGLRSQKGIAEVFYDEKAVGWLQRLAQQTGSIRLAVSGLLVAVGLLAAAFLGGAYGRIFRFPVQWRGGFKAALRGYWRPILSMCLSGVLALLLLAGFYVAAYSATVLDLAFLSPGSIALLVLAGVLEGWIAWLSLYFSARSQASASRLVTVSMLGALLWITALAGAPVRAELPPPGSTPALPPDALRPTPPDLALPQVAFDNSLYETSTTLKPLTDARREELARQTQSEIEKMDKSVRYLEDWLARSEKERTQDLANRDLNHRKLEQAKLEQTTAERVLQERYETLQNLHAALTTVQTQATSSSLFAPQAQPRREAAQSILVQETQHNFHMIEESDRPAVGRARTKVNELIEESNRLATLEKLAGHSPDSIRQEMDRLSLKRQTLADRLKLIQTAPRQATPPAVAQAAPAAPAPAPVPAPAPAAGTLVPAMALVPPAVATSPPAPGASSPAASTPPVVQPAQPSAPAAQPAQPAPQLALPDTAVGAIGIPTNDKDWGYYLFVDAGTLVYAVRGGLVLNASPVGQLGNTVVIDHGNGLSTTYAHLTEGEIGVQPGDTIRQGQPIGTAGAIKEMQRRTGIRFEVRQNGQQAALNTIPGLTVEDLPYLLQNKKPPRAKVAKK